jgi:hypothetical protein
MMGFAALYPSYRARIVGWVERSETHHRNPHPQEARWMGIAAALRASQ